MPLTRIKCGCVCRCSQHALDLQVPPAGRGVDGCRRRLPSCACPLLTDRLELLVRLLWPSPRLLWAMT